MRNGFTCEKCHAQFSIEEDRRWHSDSRQRICPRKMCSGWGPSIVDSEADPVTLPIFSWCWDNLPAARLADWRQGVRLSAHDALH